jgi:putative nucleotidyltransferase with HDIG domain
MPKQGERGDDLMDELLKRLSQAVHNVIKGDESQVEQLFELTRSGTYPEVISELAESFGLMFVKVEAREEKLKELIEDLQNKKAELEKLTEDLSQANIRMLEVLGNAIAKRDSDTHAHNYRVTVYAIRLAERVGIDVEQIKCLVKGSFLHDVGKIAIRDTILLKPGKLTEEEFEVMKTHVVHGADIIRGYEWLDEALDVVTDHHEKYDGSGYMHGLKGDEIPINARIFAISDVFDALTSKRPYKDALPVEKALEIMKAGRGSHFDPSMFDQFLSIAAEIHGLVNSADEKKLNVELGRIMASYFAC